MRRALIPWLAKAGLSVFDGGCRTAADTCHAMGTSAAPDGSAVFQLDIAQRAGFFTFSAAHAMGGNSEGLCFDDEPVEGGVDNAGFEPVDGTGLLYGKCLFFPDAGNTSFQCGLGSVDDTLCLRLFRSVEQGNIVFRHNHLERSAAAESLFLAKGLIYFHCIADFAAAGHDEIGILTAFKIAVSDKIRKNPGKLPAISWDDEHPWLF